jgi:hypothetical protein
LIIDPDALLALPVAFEGFQPVARQGGEVLQTRRCFEPIETDFGLPCKARKLADALAVGKAFGPAIGSR